MKKINAMLSVSDRARAVIARSTDSAASAATRSRPSTPNEILRKTIFHFLKFAR
ncbi:MAG: hypothetical protein HZC38_13580 [Chloroflexi bacterium]|nr:hypothetical protein [Chloroflexota bacterium]